MRRVTKTDAEWRAQLTAEEYRVLRRAGTEPAFTGKYTNDKRAGLFYCRACNVPLFRSDAKFDSGCGWPSYWKAYSKDAVRYRQDVSHGMFRTEVLCATCESHLGHVFDDGPPPTFRRYCINSVCMRHEEDDT